ncbi:MAG: hypothetical protein ABEI31_10465 [Halodesulfurarchaeum sp.]
MNTDEFLPCGECGSTEYESSADGISVTFTCATCGALLADLMDHHEP